MHTIHGDGINQNQSTIDAEINNKAVLHRSLHTVPLAVVGSHGNYLELSNGQRFFDATGGAAVACIGHQNERVKQAIIDQMNITSFCHTSLFTTSTAESLAQTLIDSTGGEMARAYFVSSGSEAMEAAMKLSRQFFLEVSPPQPKRINFIARRGSYHGTTLGSLSMGGHEARRAFFEPLLLGNISRVSPCNAYRDMLEGESIQSYVTRLQKELEDAFARVGPETVCAFVAEPVVGAALGCVPSVPGYFEAMQEVCHKHGALLIMDEVMCGMGRTGTLHAWQQLSVVPDIQTIGKGLGGGYAPIAGLLINKRIINALQNGTGGFFHGHTYQEHPLACAAALEVQRVIHEENLVENSAQMGELLGELLHKRLDSHPYVGDIRGRGLFWGIEFVQNKRTKEPFDRAHNISARIGKKGLEPKYSISLYSGTGTAGGKSGDHILLAPAYNVNEADIRMVVDLASRVIEDFFSEFFH